MATFTYKVRGRDGTTEQGELDAQNKREAQQKLRQQKVTIIRLDEKVPGLVDKLQQYNPLRPVPTAKDLVLFSRQLSTLVSAGVPIVQGLTVLEQQIENPPFKVAVGGVKTDIEGGLAIADAMKKHPEAFPTLYVSMIRAGEVGGILDTILERLSAYLESTEALKAKVKSAMMYPTVVLSICFLVTIFLMAYVVPTFKTIFADFGADLPLPTKILLGISDWTKSNIPILLGVPPALKWAFGKYYATEKGRYYVDKKLLTVPIFGTLVSKVSIAKFSRTLGTLIRSGVPIMQAMETVATTAGNAIIEEAIFKARDSIREGSRIADPLKAANVFPPMVLSMIAIGEDTGALDQMLVKIADFYDQEVDTAVEGLTSMIEPIVIVIMGIIIGSIVIAMFLPMFELGSMVE